MTGLVTVLAFTADLATVFVAGLATGFFEATGLDDFTTALAGVGLTTDLATALLAGLAWVALVLTATVLALVGTGVFPVLIVKSCLLAAYEQALIPHHLQL